jgi:YfiH family protein
VRLLGKTDAISNDADTARVLNDGRLATVDQVHGSKTVIIRNPGHHTLEADGMVTDVAGITLASRCADCQLFLAYAPDPGVIGIVHAGWKGLLAGAIPAFIHAFAETWNVLASDLLVVAGPSLCLQCSGFTDPARELPGIDPTFFDDKRADLRAIADQQLWDAGVQPTSFERMPDCTRCDHQTYWSYRGPDQEAVKAGARNVLTCRMTGVK